MNLFRSEEHIRNWTGFEVGTEEGIIPLNDLVTLFSGNYFRRRIDPDLVSRNKEYARGMVITFKEIIFAVKFQSIGLRDNFQIGPLLKNLYIGFGHFSAV